MKCSYLEIPLKNIRILEKNPRTISEENFDKLKNDISEDPEYLKQRPPLLNLIKGEYYCYAGAQRVKAAKELGYESLLCFIEENVPEKLQDKRMLRDNIHRGRWDYDLLREMEFEIIELQDIGIQIEEVSEINLDDIFEDEGGGEGKCYNKNAILFR